MWELIWDGVDLEKDEEEILYFIKTKCYEQNLTE